MLSYRREDGNLVQRPEGKFQSYFLAPYFNHNFLKKGKDKVERTKPVVGTIELINGFGN